ncbi:MAG: MFS transporter [Proteobacteria bacterium]|nr:MFS transporter [Pseudomonadota bacterium]
MSESLRRAIATGPMTPFQTAAIAVCVGLNMLDGFDILAMSFAASGVKAAWGLADFQLAKLLSAGLLGMGAGALVLGPCADRYGRRRIVLLAVALAALGMCASAAARDFGDLLVLRVVTGFGIGGTIANVAVVVSEFATDRWRRVALGAYATGYSVGATLGGALAAYAIPQFGWRAAFAIGGTLSLLLLPVAWRRLPESLDFLLTRRPSGALDRLNAQLAAMGHAPLIELPAPTAAPTVRADLRLLLRPTTLLVWAMFFCTMAGFYFVASWTPRLAHAAGLGESLGLQAGVLLNLGGIAGCALYAAIVARIDAHRLLLGALLGSVLLMLAVSLVLGQVAGTLVALLLVGVITNAAMAGLYAVGPPLYPTAVRATGMGWALGIGRLGAIAAPLVAGALADAGRGPADLYRVFAVPFALAALAMLLIGPVRPLATTPESR